LNIEFADLVTIGLLVALEGLLSADNAMVLAVIVLGLPKKEQRQALRYGILGAFAFRVIAIVFAFWLKDIQFVLLLGAAYLLWLPYEHFSGQEDAAARRRPRPATSWLGMSPFWSTVAKVELTDIVFAIDSILVAVALSDKMWVIITGGIMGVIAMRLVIGQLLVLVNRYPTLVDGAFVIIAWVGIKLILEYLHAAGYVHFEVPKWLSLGLIVVIFAIAFIMAKIEGPVEADTLDEKAEEILESTAIIADDDVVESATERTNPQSGRGPEHERSRPNREA
jgi:YkoY family integral membrane protein